MSNQIETLIPRIVARGMLGLREQAVLPRLVNGDFAPEAARKGDVIDVPLAQPIAVGDVLPSHAAPEPNLSEIQTVPITLNHWKKASFYLTDREMTQIEMQDNFMPLQMHEAIRALANAVHKSILDSSAAGKHIIGEPGMISFQPYASGTREIYHDVGVAVEARRLLNAEHAPKTGRAGLLSLDTEAQALSLPHFYNAERSGADTVRLEGEIGRKFGIDWYSSDLIAQAGQGTVSATIAAAASKGDSLIELSVSSGTIVSGQILKFSTEEIFHSVVSVEVVSGNRQRIILNAPLSKAVSTSATVSLPSETQMSMVFHRDAFALAMRPLTQGGMEQTSGSQMMSVTDPQTGLSLRLEVTRQYKQTVWEFDMLWGVALVRPELLVRIFG